MVTGAKQYDPRVAAALIKEKALQLGFSACGIARVHPLADDSAYLQKWLDAGHNGKMGYLANHADLRNDPSALVPGAKSVIVVLLNYATAFSQQSEKLKIARYAHGDDYHFVVKQFLGELLRFIAEEIAPAEGRAFCDSAPVFERRWAHEAGLGWIGLNHCLIHPEFGSFCFIGELIIDLELEYDHPIEGDCGFCGRCITSCPTQAIQPQGFLRAEKCISYLTVELKDEIPQEYRQKLSGYVVGCDRCQEVCPWNRKASAYTAPIWKADKSVLLMSDQDWLTLEQAEFKRKFSRSSLTRLGYKKLMRNCQIVFEAAETDSEAHT